MPKKSSGRKRGIQRGVSKRRVGRPKVVDGQEPNWHNETNISQFLSFSRSKLSSFGKKCFDFMLACCEKLHLIGFTRAQNGEYVPLSHKDKIWHHCAVVFCLVLAIQKNLGTIQVFVYEELRMESFMCLGFTLVYGATVLIALGVVLRPKETTDLHNSWAYISETLKQADPFCPKFHPLDNSSACLKVIFAFLASQGVAIAAALCSVIIDDVPILLFPMAAKSGVLPDGIVPRWAWKLIFAPLEWLMVQPFALVASLSCSFFFMENGLLDIYLRQIRNMKVHCMRSRRRVERMYVQLELSNGIGQVWFRIFFSPWCVALATAAIVNTFITIRYTELPLVFYIIFPYTGATCMLLTFWQSYDMFRTIQASEHILVGLLQHEAPYFRGMTRASRIEKMKRSKAMRPLVFSVAGSDFSLNLPINTWDEIVNQTLFLLSL